MKRFLFILVIIFNLTRLFADEQRLITEFSSDNGAFKLILDSKRQWHLYDTNGNTIYKIRDENFTSMTAKITNNGKSIVIIDDFAEGQDLQNRTAIWVFRNGELMKSFLFMELLENPCNVFNSAWHVGWLVKRFDFNDIQSTFVCHTNEFYTVIVDLQTGQMAKKRPSDFDDNTFVLYGTFRIRNSDFQEMKITRYIAGKRQPDDKIKFQTKFFRNGEFTTALMIKNGIDITPIEFRYDVIINGCMDYFNVP